MPVILPEVFLETPLSISLRDIAAREEPENVLLCTPEYFKVVDEKNIHMQGNAGRTNEELARSQWKAIRDVYGQLQQQQIINEISVIPGAEDCEDMVFCANQSFPWLSLQGEKIVVLSNMRHASRQREVPYFESFFLSQGYRAVHLRSALPFEGMGDLIPHPEKRLLYGGYGFRTDRAVYDELKMVLDAPIVALELVNPNFYHLDTCFLPLSASSVMICSNAFTEAGLKLIRSLFNKVYELSEEEVRKHFCLNAHVLTRKNRRIALLQQGCDRACKVLREEGYQVFEVDTSEFMKSGGSVFCMKMMYH